MKMLLAILLIAMYAPSLLAQDQTRQSAYQHGQIILSDSHIKGRVMILFGGTNDQNFLQALAVAPNKGVFICDNLDSQAATSYTEPISDDGTYKIGLTSGIWPVNETLVACGTATLKQTYEGDSVDTEFKIAAWGSAAAYANLTTQVPSLRVSFVDSQYAGARCESPLSHPEPTMPQHVATVVGTIWDHDCASQAGINKAVVQVVLYKTQEGRDFNYNSGAGDLCKVIPSSFQQDMTAVSKWFDVGDDGNVNYSLDVPFTGGSVSAVVYICTNMSYHQGSDQNSCSDTAIDADVWRKLDVTLYPNQKTRVDIKHDFTQ